MIKEIALTIPWPSSSPIANPVVNEGLKNADLGYLLSRSIEYAFYIAGFAMFIWALWGIFQFTISGGNKEEMAKARGRITWAVVGFLIIIVSFAVSGYLRDIFMQKGV
jgi:hypothetical protein